MIRVLLVDDEEPFLEITKFFLDKEPGLETDTAGSVREALEKLEKKDYDAIVSDYSMPEMDGLEFLKVLRAKGEDITFVLLTGKGREDVAVQALNLGADFYVQKGGDPKSQFAEIVNSVIHSVQEKRAQREARENSRFITEVFASILDPIVVLDLECNILRVNPAVERWYGKAEPLVGRKCYEALHGRSEPCEVCPSRSSIQMGKVARELVSASPPGQTGVSWFEVHSFPMSDHRTGQMTGVIEYGRNVTEKYRMEDALRLANERLNGIMSASPVAIILLDLQGRVVLWNKGAERMLGFTEEEVLGNLLPGVPLTNVSDFVWFISSLKEGTSFPPMELKAIRKDGVARDVSVSAAPVRDKAGAVVGIAGIVIDVTEQKADREAAVQAKKKLEMLGRVTRHDILNQLTVLMGWLAMAEAEPKSEKLRECLVKMDGASKAIGSLIGFAADYESMGVGEPQWLWIDRSFRESVGGLPVGDVRIEYDIDGVEILADPLLPRVFRNLADNSLRHGKKVKKIRISSMETEDGLVVVYQDDGVGISNDQKEQVFREGFGKNTGYGLFMAREILGMTGMTITEMGAPGEGVRFEIKVPKGQYRFSDG